MNMFRHPWSTPSLLRWSAVLTLIGLALMAWSMLVPTPLPVILAMTVGQLVGSTAFGLYVFVILRELRRSRRRPATADDEVPP